MELSNFSFHEADVLDLRQDGDRVALALGGVNCAAGACGVTVIFYGAVRIKVDSSPIDKIGMYCEDGEILGLSERPDGSFELLIEWNDFGTHSRVTKYYEISCDSLLIELRPERV